MKKVLLTGAILLLGGIAIFAQIPQEFKYQAVARDERGGLIISQSISLRISIIDSAAGGTSVYSEVHKTGTNAYGLFSINIGSGLNPTGLFSNIDWSTGDKHLKVQMDPSGGSNYYSLGTSKLLSVPYALHAKTAESSNEKITDIEYNSTSNILAITESGTTHSVVIADETDDLGNNVLNDLSDVSVSPSTGQVLKWDGAKWISGADEVNNQTLAIIGNVLSITDGNSINLSSFLDNTDSQTLNYNSGTGDLSISNGNTVNLSGISSAGYNTAFQFNSGTLTITDNGGSLNVVIPDNVNDADADPANEIQIISKNGNTITLSNSGGSFDLSSYLDNTDNQTLTFNAGSLSISGGNTVSIPDNVNDADADPANELQTISKNGNTVSLSNGGGSFVDAVDDADNVIGNEYNTSLSLNGNTLNLTDNGGTLSVNLAPLSDADADPTNELQTISKSGNTVTLSNGGGSFIDAVDDADSNPTNELQSLSLNGNTLSIVPTGLNPVNLSQFLDNTDSQNLSSSVSNKNVTLSITGGTGTTFSIDDGDSNPTNEIQTLNLAGSSLSISGGNTVVLPDNVNDADANPTNEIQTLSFSGGTLTISGGNSVNIPDNINDADNVVGNEFQNLTLNGSILGLTNSAVTVNLPTALPSGVIVMWSGTLATIPSGWALCNGSNGTPDLRDRFITSVGTGENPGATGGANSYNLSIGQLPPISFSGTTNAAGGHGHSASGTISNNGDHSHSGSTSSDGNHTHTGSTSTAGDHSHTGNTSTDGAHNHNYYLDNSGISSSGNNADGDSDADNAGTTTTNGSHSHSLNINSAGSHSHNLNLNNAGLHGHTFITSNAGSHSHTLSLSIDAVSDHTHSFTTNTIGSGNSIDNRPAYYKLAFIMKL